MTMSRNLSIPGGLLVCFIFMISQQRSSFYRNFAFTKTKGTHTHTHTNPDLIITLQRKEVTGEDFLHFNPTGKASLHLRLEAQGMKNCNNSEKDPSDCVPWPQGRSLTSILMREKTDV